MKDVLTGKFVRLSAFDPEEMSKAFPRWYLNSEYQRLLNSSARPMQSPKAELKWMEEEVGEMSPASYFFSIRTLAEDKLIGELGLDVVTWPGRDAFVGLGIGETEYWSKGYGTAMNVLMGFAYRDQPEPRDAHCLRHTSRIAHEKAASIMKSTRQQQKASAGCALHGHPARKMAGT
jgi:hypothetical protein